MTGPTAMAALETAIDALSSGEHVWAGLGLADRRVLLSQLARDTDAHAEEWVETACAIKQIPVDSALAGEEWMTGPYALLTGIAALTESLTRLGEGRSPADGYRLAPAPGNRTAIQVLPHTHFDRLLLNGYSAEVWTAPGVSPDTLVDTAGLAQRDPASTNGIGLVLGAGNILSIAPLDTLCELFAHNRVVLLKLNPVTDPMLPVLEKVFAAFIELGLVQIVTGGVDVGSAAVHHPDIDHVHITGSTHSFNAIVFGPGPEGQRRRERNEPLLDKPITGELGGVSPTIVVPGTWSAADLRHQAEHVVTQKLHNNGYNCVASQILIVSDDWEQKAAFLDEVRGAYRRVAAREAFYPGSDQRVAAALDAHSGAERIGGRALLDNLPRGATAFGEEYFGPVLGVTYLPGQAAEFLDAAVDFANDQLIGTLGANIIVDPRTERELGDRLLAAVEELRYGTIGINAWTGLGYLTARASWGAFPGHDQSDIQSGVGIVHNGLLLDHVERTILRGPFREFPRAIGGGHPTLSPRAPWFVTNRSANRTGRLLTRFAADPAWRRLPAIFASALRG